jgi:capsule polysaccharide export protein KpsC/LpsZ
MKSQYSLFSSNNRIQEVLNKTEVRAFSTPACKFLIVGSGNVLIRVKHKNNVEILHWKTVPYYLLAVSQPWVFYTVNTFAPPNTVNLWI